MSRGARKNFLFLGFALPNEEMEKVFCIDSFPQVQTHKFNWNLIKGLEHFDEFDFTYISARPVTDYPSFSEKNIKRNKWIVNIDNKKIEIQEIPFINVGLLKLVTRFFSALFYSLKKYNPKGNKAGVIVYSVHVPYMIVGLIISKIYKIDYIALWTDPPAISTNKDSSLKSKLRNIELKLSKYLMKKATKVIALTKYLAEDFAPGKPYLVMEGIIDISEINSNNKRKQTKNNYDALKIVYTGSIEKRYGIKNIVEGFNMLNSDNLILEIYGRGDYEEELKKICLENNKIIYGGFITNSVVLSIQREADFLINARSPDDEYVKYSFPSKTLEYMLSGTPLLTTMLPGIPDEYCEYLLILENNDPNTICKKLNQILKMDYEERHLLGIKALHYAKSKDYKNQAKLIINFLNSK